MNFPSRNPRIDRAPSGCPLSMDNDCWLRLLVRCTLLYKVVGVEFIGLHKALADIHTSVDNWLITRNFPAMDPPRRHWGIVTARRDSASTSGQKSAAHHSDLKSAGPSPASSPSPPFPVAHAFGPSGSKCRRRGAPRSRAAARALALGAGALWLPGEASTIADILPQRVEALLRQSPLRRRPPGVPWRGAPEERRAPGNGPLPHESHFSSRAVIALAR